MRPIERVQIQSRIVSTCHRLEELEEIFAQAIRFHRQTVVLSFRVGLWMRNGHVDGTGILNTFAMARDEQTGLREQQQA